MDTREIFHDVRRTAHALSSRARIGSGFRYERGNMTGAWQEIPHCDLPGHVLGDFELFCSMTDLTVSIDESTFAHAVATNDNTKQPR